MKEIKGTDTLKSSSEKIRKSSGGRKAATTKGIKLTASRKYRAYFALLRFNRSRFPYLLFRLSVSMTLLIEPRIMIQYALHFIASFILSSKFNNVI